MLLDERQRAGLNWVLLNFAGASNTSAAVEVLQPSPPAPPPPYVRAASTFYELQLSDIESILEQFESEFAHNVSSALGIPDENITVYAIDSNPVVVDWVARSANNTQALDIVRILVGSAGINVLEGMAGEFGDSRHH